MEGHMPNASDSMSSSSQPSQTEPTAGPSSHVFLTPTAPASKRAQRPSFRLSDDIKDHQFGCTYIRWNQVHRKSLLKPEDVSNYLMDFTARTRGKAKLAGMMDQIRQTVQGDVVSNYLKGSHAKYDSFKQNAMSKCNCPSARLRENDADRENIETDKELDTQQPPPPSDVVEINCKKPVLATGGDKEKIEMDNNMELDAQQQPPTDAVEINKKKTVFATGGDKEKTEMDNMELDAQQPLPTDAVENKKLVLATGGDKEMIEMDNKELDTHQPPPTDALEFWKKKTIFANCGLDLSEDDELDYEDN